ncbi:MAG: hypothetical protein ABH807_00050 [Candidatus Shapirobacteria bacterium]
MIPDWNKAVAGAMPGGFCALGGVATIQGFECIFQIIINLAISLIALAALIVFITGGFKFLTAGGDAKKAGEASQTITLGIAGIAIAIGAWFVMRLIEQFTGVQVTEFIIPGP